MDLYYKDVIIKNQGGMKDFNLYFYLQITGLISIHPFRRKIMYFGAEVHFSSFSLLKSAKIC